MNTKTAINSLISATQSLSHGQFKNDKDAITYWDSKVNEYRIEVQNSFDQLKEELNEADRRAGCSERKQAQLQEDAYKRNEWIRKAKKESGYDDNVSFDIVWEETLALAQKAKRSSIKY